MKPTYRIPDTPCGWRRAGDSPGQDRADQPHDGPVLDRKRPGRGIMASTRCDNSPTQPMSLTMAQRPNNRRYRRLDRAYRRRTERRTLLVIE
jgi:hypothetical protein